jgi:hypothetical protein
VFYLFANSGDLLCEASLVATECKSYADLLDVLRQRKTELDISHDVLDEVSGLQRGYSSKLLGPVPSKFFGHVSLGCILGALGLKLTISPDPEQLAKIQRRLTPRHQSFATALANKPPQKPRGAFKSIPAPRAA